MEFLVWAALGFIIYTYLGYPLGVWLHARAQGAEPAPPSPDAWPSVTVVVAVHNEAGRAGEKLRNLRALDYEPSKLQILFVSDGSSDGTVAALSGQAGVTLIAYPERRGKPHALNVALEHAKGEVIVFTDARQQLERSAVRRLVSRLLGPGIGAVSGELVHLDPATRSAASIGLYWRYEKWIRRAESRVASTVGVTGALYAIRRGDYAPLPADTILDDFVVPMRIARRGLRVVFEPGAIIHDELQPESAGERKRKVRTLAGNFQAFARHPWLFSPWQNPLFVQFVSHKVFRLFVPYAMLALLAGSLSADGPVYAALAAAQVAFYAMALPGFAIPAWRQFRLVNVAVVFLDLNWAAVLALVAFVRGRVDARWEKT